MKKKITLLSTLFLFFLCFDVQLYSQCDTIKIQSETSTDASCPGSGTVTIIATGDNLQFKFTNGPAGYPSNSNSTGEWTGLSYGVYTYKITDECNKSKTGTIEVHNAYTPMLITENTVTDICTGEGPGGTVNVTISGGKPNYQYSLVKVGESESYGAPVNSTSFSMQVSEFGIYRLSIKDACGEVRTMDINIQRSMPEIATRSWDELIPDQPCGSDAITYRLRLKDANGSTINMNDIAPATVQVWRTHSTTAIGNSDYDCADIPGMSLYNTYTIDPNPGDPSETYDFLIPYEDAIFIITTLCGDTIKYCYNFNEGQPAVLNSSVIAFQSACNGTDWDNQLITILGRGISWGTPAYSWVATPSTGATQYSSLESPSFSFTPGQFPVSLLLTDACGKTWSTTVQLPVTEGAPPIWTFDSNMNYECNTFEGSGSGTISFSSIDFPGLANANVTITGGPPGSNPVITNYQYWLNGFAVANIVPGFVYTVMIENSCGQDMSFDFTVPPNNNNLPTLQWNLTVQRDALCGQNKSNLTANANLISNYQSLEYCLYDMAYPTVPISCNSNGHFFDVPGNKTYKIKFSVVANYCSEVLADSIIILIPDDNNGQSITRKTVLICDENGQGDSGLAILEVNGSAPFTYEIIKTVDIGSPGETWIESSTNNPNNSYTWNIPLPGDPINTVYTLRSTDKCGNKVTTQASLQPINPPVGVEGGNPCIGDINYTLGIEAYAGSEFTYTWYKLPDETNPIGNSNTYTFNGAYDELYNGSYKIVYGIDGCIIRSIVYNISSDDCDSPLPIQLLAFNVEKINEMAHLTWLSNESNISHYTILRSTDGQHFDRIAKVNALNKAKSAYSFNDPITGINSKYVYYRLEIIENSGLNQYSPVKLIQQDQHVLFNVYPTIVKDEIFVSCPANKQFNLIVEVLDLNGKVVLQRELLADTETNGINVQQLNRGMYIVKLTYPSGVWTQKINIIR